MGNTEAKTAIEQFISNVISCLLFFFHLAQLILWVFSFNEGILTEQSLHTLVSCCLFCSPPMWSLCSLVVPTLSFLKNISLFPLLVCFSLLRLCQSFVGQVGPFLHLLFILSIGIIWASYLDTIYLRTARSSVPFSTLGFFSHETLLSSVRTEEEVERR